MAPFGVRSANIVNLLMELILRSEVLELMEVKKTCKGQDAFSKLARDMGLTAIA